MSTANDKTASKEATEDRPPPGAPDARVTEASKGDTTGTVDTTPGQPESLVSPQGAPTPREEIPLTTVATPAPSVQQKAPEGGRTASGRPTRTSTRAAKTAALRAAAAAAAAAAANPTEDAEVQLVAIKAKGKISRVDKTTPKKPAGVRKGAGGSSADSKPSPSKHKPGSIRNYLPEVGDTTNKSDQIAPPIPPPPEKGPPLQEAGIKRRAGHPPGPPATKRRETADRISGPFLDTNYNVDETPEDDSPQAQALREFDAGIPELSHPAESMHDIDFAQHALRNQRKLTPSEATAEEHAFKTLANSGARGGPTLQEIHRAHAYTGPYLPMGWLFLGHDRMVHVIHCVTTLPTTPTEGLFIGLHGSNLPQDPAKVVTIPLDWWQYGAMAATNASTLNKSTTGYGAPVGNTRQYPRMFPLDPR